MYDRAPRTLTGTCGCTPGHVGPGAYDAELTESKRLRADGYAPFLSMTGRDSFLNPTDTVIAAPGPGQYDPSIPQNVVKGGRTMANKSNRFSESSKDTPGPGAYNLSQKWIKDRDSSSAPANMEAKGKQGALMTNRIKFSRKPVAPSIPMPGQAYGFEENEDGTLRKQEAPDKDASLGPAFYNVKHEQTRPAKAYKGIHFGTMTSKRMNFGGKEGPGPGEYEPMVRQSTEVEHANIPEADRKKFDAKLPRYHEVVVKEEEKKAVPGPGKYEVRGQFDNKPPKVNTEGIEVEHPPFGSQAKRFNPNKINGPAPGAYNDPRTALDSVKKITGLKRSPFSQTSVRFQPDNHIRKTPGPGSYNISGMGSDSMRRAYIESTRRGVFGTTSVRVAPMTKKGEPELPGPSHYQVKEKPFKPRYQQLSSNFASLTSRLSEPAPIVKELPPPGSYNVDKAYKNSQGKRDAGNPRNDSAKRKQGAFKSSSSRFAPPRDVVLEETDPSNPGPGSYDPKRLDKLGNRMITKDNRFKAGEYKNEAPGPGAYEFSPLIQDTVLKGTFNATLNNPIAPQLDIRAGSTTNQPFLLGV